MSLQPTDINDELLTTQQVAAILQFKEQSLANMRRRGTGPRFIKLGSSAKAQVRYPRLALDAWLAEHNG
jgi:predicted DNA-binding transcriptional regulator AlpA